MNNALDQFINTKNLNVPPISVSVPEYPIPLQQTFPKEKTNFVQPVTQQVLEDCKLNFQNNDLCHTCSNEGNLLMCDSCPKTYHKHCLTNPNDKIADQWFCEACRGLTKNTACNIC